MKLNPILHSDVYIFVSIDHDEPLLAKLLPDAIAMFRENEGITVISSEPNAIKHGLEGSFRAAWISFSAETALTELGITAKFAKILSDGGISCNVFAGICHDHVFVPYDQGKAALRLLSGNL